jgi:hypothetical protein
MRQFSQYTSLYYEHNFHCLCIDHVGMGVSRRQRTYRAVASNDAEYDLAGTDQAPNGALREQSPRAGN